MDKILFRPAAADGVVAICAARSFLALQSVCCVYDVG